MYIIEIHRIVKRFIRSRKEQMIRWSFYAQKGKEERWRSSAFSSSVRSQEERPFGIDYVEPRDAFGLQ